MRQEALLDQDIGRYRTNSFASSTQQVYRSFRDTYLRYCIYFGYTPVPATRLVLARYVAFLARTVKPTNISAYLNIVRIIHLESGTSNPLQDNWYLTSVLRGIKRENGSPTISKLPITPALLRSIHSKLDMQIPYNVAFWAACLCAFSVFSENQPCYLKVLLSFPLERI